MKLKLPASIVQKFQSATPSLTAFARSTALSSPRGDGKAPARYLPTPTIASDATPEAGSDAPYLALAEALRLNPEAVERYIEYLTNAEPNPRLAFEYNARGSAYFRAQLYLEASVDFLKALVHADESDPNRFVYMIDLANVAQMTWRHDEAETIYNAVIAGGGVPENLAAFARDELGKLVARRQQGIPYLRSEDARLLRIAAQLIYRYPDMRRTVKLRFVGEDEESLNRIIRIQEAAGMQPSDQIRTLEGWTAIGHIIGGEHWIFVKDAWKDASDSALKGLLSHEFAHEELKDTQATYVVHPNQSHLGFICNERATDLLAIAKGFGRDLLESRRHMEMKDDPVYSLGHQAALMSPQEIELLLDSPASIQAEASFQMQFAVELAQGLDRDSPVVQEEFRKAVPLWERVIESAPQSALGYWELAVAHYWLGEIQEALRRVNAAVELDPSNEEYRRLAANWENELRERSV